MKKRILFLMLSLNFVLLTINTKNTKVTKVKAKSLKKGLITNTEVSNNNNLDKNKDLKAVSDLNTTTNISDNKNIKETENIDQPKKPEPFIESLPEAIKITSNSSEAIKDNPNFTLIDKIEAIVYNPEGTSPVLLSDQRPGVDGVPRTLENEIDKRLILFDAQRFKIEVNEDDVNKYLSHIQKENGLNREDIERMFDELGYTFEEGKELLRTNQLVETTINFKTRASITVDSEEVVKYYENNPIYKPAKYTLKVITVPYDKSISLTDQINKAKQDISNINNNNIWSDSVSFDEDELSIENHFIVEMQPGEISFAGENSDGLEFIKLISKEQKDIVALDADRRQKIEFKIKKEKYDDSVKKYKENLRKESEIKYCT